ncbi:MAG: sigma-70 family RNA polymerase sigma factor [Lachnospiraceae bacterium]|nr:sigma-70 family RNA polymerase sigma factor [Lachnospiraceae bacterium]
MLLLVKRAQKGDAEAFVTLIESCKSSMYKIARGFFTSEDDIADAIGETVLKAYEHISEVKHAAYFKTWLMRILINSCNEVLRDRKHCETMEILPEEGYQDQSLAEVEFRDMLSEFPEDCRTIIQLYYGEQFNTREIADILDMNENTVKSKLRRTRQTLREHMLMSVI